MEHKLDGPEIRKNPLMADRTVKEVELLRWVREIAARDKRDPVEVMAGLSEWRGHSYVNPSAMPDDRLLHAWMSAKRAVRPVDPTPERPPLDEAKVRALAVYLRRKSGDLSRPVEEFLEQARELSRG